MIQQTLVPFLCRIAVGITLTLGYAFDLLGVVEPRYSSSSNRIYLEGSGTMTIGELSDYITTNNQPWGFVTNTAEGTFETSTTIFVEDGVTFIIEPATIASVTIDQLRLLVTPTTFAGIEADYGNLVINNMTITSWDSDPLKSGPDTTIEDGRPFISANARDPEDYDLVLMSVAGTGDLEPEGRSLAVVALVGANLHIRIFNANGQIVIDKNEAELVSGPELTSLKDLLNQSPFPDPYGFSNRTTAEYVEKAALISNYPYPNQSEIRPSNLTITNSTLSYLGWNSPLQSAANWIIERNDSVEYSNQTISNTTFSNCFFNARDLERPEMSFVGNTFDSCFMGDFNPAFQGSNTVTNPMAAEVRARIGSATDDETFLTRIYVLGPGSSDPSYIRMSLEWPTRDPSNFLELIDPANRIWIFRANQVRLEQGARLNIHGTAIGGDCDELRLKSNGDNSELDYAMIRGKHAHIDIRNTFITSWDENTLGPDLTPSKDTFDANKLVTLSGLQEYRAHIWVASEAPLNGESRESRMDIVDSEIAYLGYHDSLAWGLSWKVEGVIGEEPRTLIPGTDPPEYTAHANCRPPAKYVPASTWGDITGSHLHHLHFGVYTFGHGSHEDGGIQTQWINNEVNHCNVYGFDPHDDSDNILIQNNDVHHNGKHGIIASKYCDNIRIIDNHCHNNGQTRPVDGVLRSVGHGIMIHHGSNDAIIEDNLCEDNFESGIAVFDSCRVQIRNNTIEGNLGSGIRFNVGSTDCLFEDNSVSDCGTYAVHMFQGSDGAKYANPLKINSNIIIQNNTFDGTSGDGIKIQISDGVLFEGNTFTNITNGIFRFEASSNCYLRNNTFPSNALIKIRDYRIDPGDPGDTNADVPEEQIYDLPTSVIFSEQGMLNVEMRAQYGAVSTGSFDWTPGTQEILPEKRQFKVSNDSGAVVASPQVWTQSGTLAKRFITKSSESGQVLSIEVGDLENSHLYDVMKDGALLHQALVSDETGLIAFTDTSTSDELVTYQLIDAMAPYTAWAGINGLVGPNSDGNADPDGDGNINVMEFLLGFNPLDSNQFLDFTMNPMPDGSWDFSVNRVLVRGTFEFQSAPAPSGPWTTESTLLITADDTDFQFMRPSLSGTRNFYRVHFTP